MFRALIRHVPLLVISLAVATVSSAQSAKEVMSNREARKAATIILEATEPPGFSVTAFSVRISVGADGAVKHVSNSHSLPAPLFATAAQTARQWRFPSSSEGGKAHGFEAEITFHGPIDGTVRAKDGTAIAGVVVSGSEFYCCPTKRDSMTTDKSGSFHIEHPGAVLHFRPADSFQPRSLVVTDEMSNLTVTLAPETTRLALAPCKVPGPDVERIGWGKYGLQFDVPRHDVKLIRGKVDVDYLVDIVKAKNSDNRIEFWFGPYAMGSTADDEQYVESETFTTRDVFMTRGLVRGSNGGVIGTDTWGHTLDGKAWRHTAIGMQGARYQDVNLDNAAVFDRIIDSACWNPDPENP